MIFLEMPQMISDQSPTGKTDLDGLTRLRRTPRLDPKKLFSFSTPCKVCGADSFLFDRVDFNKYCNLDNFYRFGFAEINVDYFRCSRCGFLFTSFCDDWSLADFREFIYNGDYIKIDSEYADVRPNREADILAERFRGAEAARILDYGSGAGVFVQRMRERGFCRIEGYDPFSSPARPEGRFDIITCFEVIEHSTDPIGTVDDMVAFLKPDGCILLSQTLQPNDILSIRGNWWYLAPRNGHVSTFTDEALEIVGRPKGLFFYRGDTVYGFAGPKPSSHAQIALASIGPSFATVRLYAPSIMADAAIFFPSPERVLWHRKECADAREYRWTGGCRRLEWQAKWPSVTRLRVHLPLVSEASPGFSANCVLSLDGVQQPIKLVRGEMTAEFDVAGKTSGTIILLTPEPVQHDTEPGRMLGLAIATKHDAGQVKADTQQKRREIKR